MLGLGKGFIHAAVSAFCLSVKSCVPIYVCKCVFITKNGKKEVACECGLVWVYDCSPV